MGVDCSSIVAYGDFLEDVEFIEDESKDGKLFFRDELDRICFDYDKADELGLKIVQEPYNLSWVFIGVPFLEKTPEETIEALKTVREKWNLVIDNLKEVLSEEIINKLEPAIVEEAYFS